MGAPKKAKQGYIGHVESFETLYTKIAKPYCYSSWPANHQGVYRGERFHIKETRNTFIVEIKRKRQRFSSMLGCWHYILRIMGERL